MADIVASATDARAKEVIDDWNRLDGDRGTWKTHWQDCADLTNTNRADYVFQRTPGMKRQTKIYDATPVWARRQFQNGLHSYLTSPAVQWFALRADSERLNMVPAVRAWLDAVTAVLYNLFSSPRFNFAAQSDEVYGDLGCIGTWRRQPSVVTWSDKYRGSENHVEYRVASSGVTALHGRYTTQISNGRMNAEND